MSGQDGFWQAGEDLPLFSGTAVRVSEPGKFSPAPTSDQAPLFKCRVCWDTGRIVVNGKSYRCECQNKAREG